MALSTAAQMVVIKADIDDDVRRINMTLSADAPAPEMLEAIRAAVAQSFDMEEASLPALKYKDEDGDLCTLVAASMEDMLDLNNMGTLRLFASSNTQMVEGKAVTSEMLPKLEASVADTAAPPNSSEPFQAEEEPEAQQTENTESFHEVAELTAMGFSEEQSHQALQDAHGNVELAVEYLVHGPRSRQTQMEKLEHKVRALPAHVVEQLHKVQTQLHVMVANIQQHRVDIQECVQNGEWDRLQSLQVALYEIQRGLRDLRELGKGTWKKAQGTAPNASEEEQLQKVEAQLVDAQRFVSDTLASLQAHGCELLKGATPKCSNTHEGVGPRDGAVSDSSAATMETMDAAAAAAVDAAVEAKATVDELLPDEAAIAPDASEAAPEPCLQQTNQDATKLDHAQVFLSQAISAIRSQAADLFKRKHSDSRMAIPASTTTSPPPPQDAEAAAAVNNSELEGAHDVPASSAQDELLLLDDANKESTTEQEAELSK